MAAALLALLAAVAVSAVPGVRDAAHRAAQPVWNAGSKSEQALSSVYALLRSRMSLMREIEALRSDIRALRLELFEMPILRAENERLQELWGRRAYESSLLGRVLARPNITPYDTLVIDVGEPDGIGVGDIVLADRVAIGRVMDVFSKTSVVQLFSAPGAETDVLIATSSIAVTATGRGGGNFVGEIPRGVEVSEGDAIVLLDARERLFALVESVEADASDPLQTVRFQLPVNMFAVDWVEIIVDGARPLRLDETFNAKLEPDA